MTLDLPLLRKPRAGRRAEARYVELRRRWRRRVLPRARWVFWPLMALGLLGSALPGKWAWSAGAFFGMSLALWMVLRDNVPQHIERWLDGAEGERATERELRVLERDGWLVLHDLPRNPDNLEVGSNIDHVVIGPPGVFLLDSKNWGGHVTVDGGVATVTPVDNPDAEWSTSAVTRTIKQDSKRSHDAVQASTRINEWVTPVVVLWAPFAQRLVTSEGVVFVQGEALVEYLRGLPERLPRHAQLRIAAVFARHSHPSERTG